MGLRAWKSFAAGSGCDKHSLPVGTFDLVDLLDLAIGQPMTELSLEQVLEKGKVAINW